MLEQRQPPILDPGELGSGVRQPAHDAHGSGLHGFPHVGNGVGHGDENTARRRCARGMNGRVGRTVRCEQTPLLNVDIVVD